jgi:hypothetical protein
MAPRALPCAIGHVSTIGPLTAPPAIFVTDIFNGSPAAEAASTALHEACGRTSCMLSGV